MVVEIRGDKVRLGIKAPRNVPVHRREVYDAIQRAEQRNRPGQKRQAPPDKPSDQQVQLALETLGHYGQFQPGQDGYAALNVLRNYVESHR